LHQKQLKEVGLIREGEEGLVDTVDTVVEVVVPLEEGAEAGPGTSGVAVAQVAADMWVEELIEVAVDHSAAAAEVAADSALVAVAVVLGLMAEIHKGELGFLEMKTKQNTLAYEQSHLFSVIIPLHQNPPQQP
jgi:hypothetical protein